MTKIFGKLLSCSVAIAALMLVPISGLAVPPEVKGISGTLACGGDHNTDERLNRGNATRWVFHNFNDSGDIWLKSIKVYYAGGAPFDSTVNDWPAAWANVLDPGDPVLVPHGTVRLTSEGIYPFILSQVEQPYYGSLLQMIVEWEANEEVAPPNGVVVVATYGNRGRELMARHAAKCTLMELSTE